ncbi:SAM-dependent methyltransferase [Nocardiopsis potens]|uniref:SAM-dependent methyltransferase n=1 Tax=Nocardiopsis potens TaxID=1246458 RepID=UPI00034908A5|nr:class I SAM-dependent methyltransferase [Nocardiopsis potens]
MATPGTDLFSRIDALVGEAWTLAALASAVSAERSGAGLSEEHGALLGAAGFAERTASGWRLRDEYRAALRARPDAGALPGRTARLLRLAADAAEGAVEEPADGDEVLLAEGRASGERVSGLLDLAARHDPGLADLLLRPGAVLLDVGTGVGGVAAALVERVPGGRAVGLDTDPRMLRLAERHLAERGVRDRVEPRLQDVADLIEEDAYDLVWLPLAVLSPEAAAAALPRVAAALRPGGRLIAATALRSAPQLAPEDTGPRAVRDAVLRWRMSRRNVTPWPPEELAERLTAAGLRSAREIPTPDRSVAVVLAAA